MLFSMRAMSYALRSAQDCANRLSGQRVPARFRWGRRVAMVAALPVMAMGCGGGIKGASRSEGWYSPDSIPQFVADTSKPPVNDLAPEYVIGVNDKLEVVFLYHNNLTTRDL